MFDTLKLARNPYLEPVTFIFFCLIFSLSAHAQKTEKYFEKAESYYRIQKYEKAIKCYNKIMDAGEYDEQTYLQCARCYERIEKYSKADELFTQIIFKSDTVEPEIFLEYGDLLMKLGRNDEARSYFMSYNNLMENNDLRVLRNIKSIEDIDKYYQDTSFIRIELLALSSEAEDYNPREYGNHIYFESNKDYIDSDPVLRSLYIQSVADSNSNKSKKISGSGKQVLKGFAMAGSTDEVYMAGYPGIARKTS